MHVTMVKKRLASGEPCRKCAQVEEMLRNRGLWERVDRVVWADETDAQSEGSQLAAAHEVDLAPFFIVRDDANAEKVYTSAITLVKEALTPTSGAVANAAATNNDELSEGDLARLAVEFESASPEHILRWALTRFGADCALSFSGAEDVVLIDMASKLGLPFSVFSLDTGRLHAETYRFLEKVRKHYGVELLVVTPDAAKLQPFVRKKGLFSFYEDGHHECCDLRKVEPLGRTLAGFRAWVTGQRKDQSVTRSALAVLAKDARFSGKAGPLLKFNPLSNWSSAQVWNYLRDNHVPYNELHDRGFISIGCEPCTRATGPAEHERAGRWWWEAETQRECGLHHPR
jgi:phosphoadenosine phosphosulfate reductase